MENNVKQKSTEKADDIEVDNNVADEQNSGQRMDMSRQACN